MKPRVLCIATAGAGGQDALRMRRLTAGLDAETTYYDLDRRLGRSAAIRAVGDTLRSAAYDLVYLEGTGIAGGLPLIRAARTRRQKFIVSSGDPIGGFFHTTSGPLAGRVFGFYEKLLYKACAGFVGWTPYLTGMALRMGAKRGVTVEGAVDLDLFTPGAPPERQAAKARFGLKPQHRVCGGVGSLKWTPRQSYCYGLELVEMLKRLKRQDVSMLIVGDGDGKARLEQAVPESLRGRAVFTGRVPQDQVVSAMRAMDIGFVTQTLDGLGSYRLTTKLPEYLACGVPVAMSPVPGYYDYVGEAGWALPPCHPAQSAFHDRGARWLETLCHADVLAKAGAARPAAVRAFDYEVLSRRFVRFVEELLPVAKAT